MLRVDGVMRPAEGAPSLTREDTERIVTSLLPAEVLEEFLREKDADFSFGWEDRARFRANAFVQRGAMGLSLRLIPFRIPSFEELGLARGDRAVGARAARPRARDRPDRRRASRRRSPR